MRKFFLPALFILFIFSGCQSDELNLSICKKSVREIYKSGRYDSELQKAIVDAEAGIDFAVSGKTAAVFDIDETVLSNYSYLNSVDFGYMSEDWDNWILQSKGEPIIPSLELYKRLLSRGIHIIFLTGRGAGQYEATYKNLVNAGFTKFDTLIMRRSSGANLNAGKSKEAERTKLVQDGGYTIIACIGDQWSDMEGAFTGKKIKLPNYIYLIN
jgi:predicted secreted acid phosphatase